MSRPRVSISPAEALGTRDVRTREAAALRGAKLTPVCGSLLAEAVNEISRPVASAQGAVVAQIHLTRDRRFRSRTRNTLLEPLRSIRQDCSGTLWLLPIRVDEWLRRVRQDTGAALRR